MNKLEHNPVRKTWLNVEKLVAPSYQSNFESEYKKNEWAFISRSIKLKVALEPNPWLIEKVVQMKPRSLRSYMLKDPLSYESLALRSRQQMMCVFF